MEKRSLLRGAAALIVGRGVSAVITIAVPLVIVRALSIEEFGLYKQILLVGGFLCQVLPFGLLASLYYFVPQSVDRRTSYVVQTELVLVAVSVLAALLLVGFRQPIAIWLGNPALADYAFEIGLYSSVTLLSAALEIILVIDGRELQAAIVTVLSEVVKGFALLMPIVMFRDFHVMMWALIALGVVRLVGLLIYIKWSWEGGEYLVTRGSLKDQIIYSLPFGLAGLVLVLQLNLDRYFVSAMAGPAGFAIYSIGCFQLPILHIMQHSFAEVTLTKMANCRSTGNLSELIHSWKQCTKYLAMVFVPAWVLITIVRHEFVALVFTERYLDSVPILAIASLAIPLSAFVPDIILRIYGDTRVLLYVTLAAAIIMGVTLYPLMLWLGLMGAALSSVLALAVNQCLWLYRSAYLLNIRIKELFPFLDYRKILMMSAISGLVAEIIRRIPESGVLSIILASSAFAIVYCILLLRSDLVEQYHKDRITFELNRIRKVVLGTA